MKKGLLCAWGWKNRKPFFIDLLMGKQVLIALGKKTLMLWGALDGWDANTTAIAYLFNLKNSIIYSNY